MEFRDFPLAEAEGAVLAHSLRRPGLVFKKGRVLSAADIEALRGEGLASVTAARLAPDDVGEDIAAGRIAAVLQGDGIRASSATTGRTNLFAETPGILIYDTAQLDALNLVDEAITVAAISPNDVVEPKRMVATVKIIPYAVAERAVAEVERLAKEATKPLFRVAPFTGIKVGLIQSVLPGLKKSVFDKTLRVIEGRVAHIRGEFLGERRCSHDKAAITEAIRASKNDGAQMILVVGASAITDRRDVIPSAIEAAGGRLEHLGMPVDPGNLLLLAELDPETPVLGMPGCVRSPKLNGADWVMERLGAGLKVTASDIKRMGAGGLLMEIPSRPLPREKATAPISSNS
jgi:molybdenum cofactor cytidylyltransferase